MPRTKQEGPVSASTSDYESDELEVEEMPEPTPLMLLSVPPDDLEGKAIYDTIQAVWSSRNKPAVPDRMRTGIALFGDTVRNLRDSWKLKNEALKQAELANIATVPVLKEEVARYRRLMENVVNKASEIGHESHLRKYVSSRFLLILRPIRPCPIKRQPTGFASRHIYVEMKNQQILASLSECHNKGITISLKAIRPEIVLIRTLWFQLAKLNSVPEQHE